jgi:peptidoglycan/xylan/chitin deacetylase (PgdA/CDA1 family)
MRRSVVLLAAGLARLGLPRAGLAARRFGLWGCAGLTVVIYHRVVPPGDIDDLDPDLIDATPEDFDRQMAYLRQNFRPVGLEEVLTAHRGGAPLPSHSVLVTFDDGYRDNFEHALPILLRHGMKAVFFVSTGHLTDRRLFWWEQLSLLVRRSAVARTRIEYPHIEELNLSTPAAKALATRRLNRIVKDCYGLDIDRFLSCVARACAVNWTEAEGRARADRALMTWDQVKALRAAGMAIGSHTHGHRVLNTLPAADLDQELGQSRAILEDRLGEPITTIAYPVGKPIASLIAVRKSLSDAGYELGFTTRPGMNRMGVGDDPFDLRRLSIDRGVPAGLAQLYLSFPALARSLTLA